MFGLSGTGLVGFDADNKLFGYMYYDDSTFTPGTNPVPNGDGKAYYQWYVPILNICFPNYLSDSLVCNS